MANFKSIRVGRVAAFVLVLSLGGACGGEDGTSEPRDLCDSQFVGAPSCVIPNFEEEVLSAKLEGCAGDGTACHAAGTAQSTLILDVTAPGMSVDEQIAALIGQDGLGGPFVDTTCVDASTLLTKLTPNWGGGSRMPLGDAPWSADEIECFRAYLNEMFME